ncbi:MAG: hypothetical protein KGZ93_02175 [Actinobacteria bacterium]|nr:hypothetical protein [Actinomycetota bacterium]
MRFGEFVKQVADANPLVDTISKYGRSPMSEYLDLWKTYCCFHRDSYASLKVYKDSPNQFWCFSCPSNGDVFDFMARLKKTTRLGALIFLAIKSKIEIPETFDDIDPVLEARILAAKERFCRKKRSKK